MLIPKSPGLAVPTPRVPTPVTTNDWVPIPAWNFCAGWVVPIPTRPESVTTKEVSPAPTWNLVSGCVDPIPTRPPVCPSKSDVLDIATNTVPEAPTLCLWYTVR